MDTCGTWQTRTSENCEGEKNMVENVNDKENLPIKNINNSDICEMVLLKKIVIVYTNIDSYANKIGDSKSYLSTMNEASTPHIIALTEVNANNYKFAMQESELPTTWLQPV